MENIAKICRLCMKQEYCMHGIFDGIPGDESIYVKLMDYMGLNIIKDDGLPHVICYRCHYQLDVCVNFMKLCYTSEASLRKTVAAQVGQGKAAPSAGPIFEQSAIGAGGEAVIKADPNAVDYESEYEPENAAQAAEPVEWKAPTAFLPFFEQSAIGSGEEDVVKEVGPSSLDYESEYKLKYEPLDYESEVNAANDVKDVHTNNGQSVSMCKYCDYAFTNQTDCIGHESTAHDNEVPYTCDMCEMVFFSGRREYAVHLKSFHQIDKPYNCPQCDLTFAQRCDLRKHTVVHTAIRPYTCTICSKAFSNKWNLSKHVKLHSGERLFICAECEKAFTSKYDLTRHALVHSREKLFKCNVCNLSFSRKDKLLWHQKNRHSTKIL